MLVRVRAAGVNPIDWKLRAGYLQAFMPVELPHILATTWRAPSRRSAWA